MKRLILLVLIPFVLFPQTKTVSPNWVKARIADSLNVVRISIAGLADDIAAKAPIASPTFTGTVTLPVNTSIGNASSTNIQYLSGLSGNIMTLLNSKLNTSGGTIGSLNITSDFKPYEAGVPTLGTQSLYWKELWSKTWKYHPGLFTATVQFPTVTEDITITLPNKTGTLMVGSDTASLSSRIDLKAPIANPVFTGTPKISMDTVATRSYVRGWVAGGEGGSGIWGFITGTLGDQTDLITVLDSLGQGWASKLNASDTASLSNRIDLKLNTADFPTALTNHFFSGEDSLHYGVDSIVITHGVGETPLVKNISFTLNSNGFGYSIWVNPETITSTTFTIRRNDVPTELPTDAIKFNWMIRKE